MRRSLLYKLLLIVMLLPALLFCRAQSGFVYKTALENVKEPGFYKIMLQPETVAKCRKELYDIRIFDHNGKQVPYLLRTDYNNYSENNFIELPMLSIQQNTDSQTHVVVENKLNKPLNELTLVIRNTDASRTVTISGSDNQQRWFVIKENIFLDNVSSTGNDRFNQSVQFPASSYKYFTIIINGKGLLPINIMRAGVYEDVRYNSKYVDLPGPAVYQKDSTDKSYIRLIFNDEYVIEKIDLNVEGPKFFNRPVFINEGYFSEQNAYHLRPDATAISSVNVKAKELNLVIYNEDNPALKIKSAKAYQLNSYLLTWLEPGNTYTMFFGDAAVKAPRYDLQFFKDSIQNNFKEIATGPVTNNPLVSATKQPKDNHQKTLLWLILAAVGTLLLFFTWRMAKEIKQ